MKKTITTLLSAAVLASAVSAKAASVTPLSVTEKDLDAGRMTVYDYGTIKLHAYATGDALNDEAYIVEGRDSLVGIELPSFTAGLDAWKKYIRSLQKPMNDIFLASHPAGASYIKGMNIYGTEGVVESMTGGAVYATTTGLHKVFGDDFHGNDMAKINKVVPAGKITVAGINFKVIDRGGEYDLEIPEANAVYTHMLGKKVHSIVTGRKHLDAMLEVLTEYQKKGYDMILSAHAEPEGQDAVAEKITYLQKLKDLLKQNQTGASFKKAVIAFFPDYAGENYLDMTVNSLYPDKTPD